MKWPRAKKKPAIRGFIKCFHRKIFIAMVRPVLILILNIQNWSFHTNPAKFNSSIILYFLPGFPYKLLPLCHLLLIVDLIPNQILSHIVMFDLWLFSHRFQKRYHTLIIFEFFLFTQMFFRLYDLFVIVLQLLLSNCAMSLFWKWRVG